MANEGQLKFGISGTEMATDMKAQYNQLSRDIHTAYQSGDRSRAAILTAQHSAIAERLHGTQRLSEQADRFDGAPTTTRLPPGAEFS